MVREFPLVELISRVSNVSNVADNVKSEDSLVFLAVSPGPTYAGVIRAVEKFFRRKQEIDPQDRFNFVAFRESGPVYFEDYTYSIDHVSSTLAQIGPELATPNLAGGIFVAVTFIIDVFKIVGGKCFRLVVVVDDGAPRLTKEEVLADLLYQVRDMPFIMDVVRLGRCDDVEDWGLEKLAKITRGALYHARDVKELASVLSDLAEKKQFWDASPLSEQKFTIGVDNIPFYMNMADAPERVTHEDLKPGDRCSICFQQQCPRCAKSELVRCPKCSALAHDCCWANWAKSSQVGLSYLFRCHQCFNLLKLPRQFVEEVQSGRLPVPAVHASFSPASQFEVLKEKDEAAAPLLVDAQDPFAAMVGELEEVKESVAKAVDSAGSTPAGTTACPACGASLPASAKFCNKCGARVRRPGSPPPGSIMRLDWR
ncbi:MAG: hypothetical protein Kow0069_17810 [Promethearchaeota archaeon]